MCGQGCLEARWFAQGQIQEGIFWGPTTLILRAICFIFSKKGGGGGSRPLDPSWIWPMVTPVAAGMLSSCMPSSPLIGVQKRWGGGGGGGNHLLGEICIIFS